MDEDDGLYDSLPDLGDFQNPSAEEPSSGENIFLLPFDGNLSAVKNINYQNKKELIKRCICRESVQWAWEPSDASTFVEIGNNDVDVKFHRNQSNGTAVVRCTEPMCGNQYYWEVKITHPVYGTDVMIGVGTPDVEMKDVENRYISLLGNDNKTWGLSYTGAFQHNGVRNNYTQCFRQGDIVGIHLDFWRGTLSFYKDRKNLGIATSGLKGKTLYAMASSTAAYSGMRIIHSCSFPSSLQFLCCYKLRELIPGDKSVLDVLNFPPGLKQYLKKKLNWLLSKQHFDASDACDYNHDQSTYENIADESGMGSVIDTLMNGNRSCVLFDSVLFTNLNRFQGQNQRPRRLPHNEEVGNLSQTIVKRLRRSSSQDPDFDSD